MRLFNSALAAFLLVSAPTSADITGPVRVVDGDTLRVLSHKIRLADIDAPERRQTCWRASGEFRCGLRATAVLKAIIGAQTVRCVEKGRWTPRVAARGGIITSGFSGGRARVRRRGYRSFLDGTGIPLPHDTSICGSRKFATPAKPAAARLAD